MYLKYSFLIAYITLIINTLSAQNKILFDATKAETAANADWVIDADANNLSWSPTAVLGGTESNAQRIPTPAQSTITATTVETYWKGALSSWGIDCVKKGFTVETLPYTGRITFNDATNPQDLSKYKAFIVCEPNLLFSSAEKTAILAYVQAGGGLFMVSDHQTSDRNNDGKDSPVIWNDLMANNGAVANPFGITFENNNIGNINSNNLAVLPLNDSLLHGSMGNVTQIAFHAGSTIAINKTANSSAHGVIYTANVSNTGTTGILCVAAFYGKGRVVALGDSSIPDDGTGDSNDNIFNGYSADAYANDNGQKLLMNATIWLASSGNIASAIDEKDVSATENSSSSIKIAPNPVTSDVVFFEIKDAQNTVVDIQIFNALGMCVVSKKGDILRGSTTQMGIENLPIGLYFLSIWNDKMHLVERFVKN
jgi:Secretion system C-terminal sorting domain